jgi:hypothetical protein
MNKSNQIVFVTFAECGSGGGHELITDSQPQPGALGCLPWVGGGDGRGWKVKLRWAPLSLALPHHWGVQLALRVTVRNLMMSWQLGPLEREFPGLS